jgi:hypothetical protein
LTIRARVRADLERLSTYVPDMSAIIESEDSDYRYRAVANRGAVSSAMAKLVADIDYDNFKNEVASRQGYQRASVYGQVWHKLYDLQNGRFEEPPELRML